MNDIALDQSREGFPTQRPAPLTPRYQPVEAEPSSDQFGLVDLIRTFERHKVLVLSIIALVTLGTLVWQLTSPSLYRSTANIKVELIDETGTNQADVLARNSQRLANESKLYRSRNSAQMVVESLGLLNDPDFLDEMGGAPGGDESKRMTAAISTVLDMTRVESEDGSDLIELAAISRSPELAARIANSFPEAVRDLKRARDAGRREELLAELSTERDARMQRAVEAAEELAEFRVKNRMLVGAGGAEDLAQINRIASEAASASAMGSGSAAQSAGIASAASINSTAGATSAAVQQLQRQEAQLSAELARLSQTYGSGYPELARVESELQNVRSNLAREEEAARRAAQDQANAEAARMRQMAQADAARDAARASQLQSVVASLTSRAYQNAANTPLLQELEREAQTTAAAVAEIGDQITQVQSEKLVEGVSSNIISPATPNGERISPSPLKTTIVAMLGAGILAVMVAFMIDVLDDRLRTVAQIRKYFALPVFGMLPDMSGGISSKLRESPVFGEPQSLFAEVARSIYAETRALMPLNQSQSVLITSPLPGDGKSVIALTIAAAAVAMGKKAVILDLDLRRSGILQKIQKDIDAPELMDLVRGNVDLHALLAPPSEEDNGEAETSMDLAFHDNAEDMLSRFMLFSASQPVAEPAAVLSSSRFRQLVIELKSRFDLVVVNAPATLAVRDARSMTDYTDDTLVVAKWGDTTIEQMRATLELLGSSNVAGCIYNQVDYAEHARRKYGDSIQFYFEASDYFEGDFPGKLTLREQFVRFFRGRSYHKSSAL
ncbi:MAG: Wzz/FepE/Etk N-terminal domain-containing protein [Erythrobacter sp.]|uniref:GumC family protein n=1 Tax=Erythrobacter sp. TaxID=1042 RepID=UPI002609BD8F|nr:tyrosine-protein kinase domain-containing protein [Erythrobacter sp.]MDJ0978683.1 Wzz/FepE/Etk N-terminal domain-containing protein [Erythrobacter sp.]